MGWAAARKLRRVLVNLQSILGVEALCAARALLLRAPLEPGPATRAAAALVNEATGGPGPDRHLAPELDAAASLVGSGALLDAVQAVSGELL